MSNEAPQAAQGPQAQAPQAPALAVRVTAGLLAWRMLQGLVTYMLLRAQGLITLPLFTRLLGPEGMGILALSGATVNLVWPVAVLGLNTGLAVQAVHLRSAHDIRKAHSSVILTTLCTAIVGGGLLTGLLRFFGPGVGLTSLSPYAVAIGCCVVMAGLKEVAIVIPQVAQRTMLVSAVHLTAGFGGTALAILLVLRGSGPVGALWGNAIALLIAAAWAIAYTAQRFGFTWRIDRTLLKESLTVALPVIPVSAGQWALQALDSYFLAYFHGHAIVGIYSVAYSLASPALAVNAALNFVFLPSAGALYQQGLDRFTAFARQALRLTTYVLGLACVGSAVLAPWGVRLVAGPGFDGAVAVVPWVVAGYSVWTLALRMQAVLFVVQRRSASVAWTYGVTTLLNAVLNLLLIPKGGMIGAAIATALSYGAGFLLLRRIACAVVPGLSDWRSVLLPWLPAVAVLPLALRWASPAGAPIWDPIARIAVLVFVYLALGVVLGIVRRSDFQSLHADGESPGEAR